MSIIINKDRIIVIIIIIVEYAKQKLTLESTHYDTLTFIIKIILGEF